MATVYKAKDLVLNRYVAVKVLRDEFTTDEEFVKRFNIEAQAAASITDPNIVSVYDVGKEDNLYFIVMELVKGKTLKDIIVEDGTLGWKWSVKVAMQIASALETAHRNNIVHRDIKPHNIIITEEGVAKVTDFGIAKAVSNSTITAFGTTMGSVHYFSPEHARGGFTDAKSDIYSLGVVLYEMLTGKVPFDSDTPVSVALKHMQEEPIAPITLKPNIPQSVNDIIIKAMQKNPEERYRDATEMLRDLEKSLKNPSGEFVFEGDNRDFRTQRISLDYTKKANSEDRKENKKEGKFAKIGKFFEEHPVVKIFAIILSCIFVFAIAMGGTYLALSLGKAKEVVLPNLTNLTLEQAQAKADELKIKLEVQEEKYDPEIPLGQIISQDPSYQDNYNIKEGSTVKVIISKGQEIVKMPKVIGLKRDEAIKTLRDAKLEFIVKEENNDEIEKDYVIKQTTEDEKEIVEETEIPAGTKIIIYVSMGIEQVEVPDLSGKTESEAKSAISNAKLKWKSTDKISDSSKPNGVVVNQSVSAGSMVDKDTEITITVNEFDEVKTATINVNVKSLRNYVPEYETDDNGNQTLINSPEKVTLKITVGNDTVYDNSVSEDNEKISKSISGKGMTEIKVYINGVLQKQNLQFNFNTSTEWTAE
jgi:serine/threonine-protein kinase